VSFTALLGLLLKPLLEAWHPKVADVEGDSFQPAAGLCPLQGSARSTREAVTPTVAIAVSATAAVLHGVHLCDVSFVVCAVIPVANSRNRPGQWQVSVHIWFHVWIWRCRASHAVLCCHVCPCQGMQYQAAVPNCIERQHCVP
jgi:hypothetical protein